MEHRTEEGIADNTETETDDEAGDPIPGPAVKPRSFAWLALLISMGWLGTNLGLAVANLPLKFLLKDELRLGPREVAAFFAIGEFSNYIKPVAGLLCDSVPLFRTRRRWYLLLSLIGTGIGWYLMGVVPRHYKSLLLTYSLLYITVVFTSTSLGGVMVEVGQRFKAGGRLTSQRIGMFRLGTLVGQPLGGVLAMHPFGYAVGLAAALHLVLVPLFFVHLPEKPVAHVNRRVWKEAFEQLRKIFRSHVLLSAAGMVCLVAASPGFGTPLLYHQTDVLAFKKEFIGLLGAVSSAFGLLGAMLYYAFCRRLSLRALLAWSIVVHALGTLFYLGYHSLTSAIIVTAISGMTGTLAILPIYDLAIRATPRGCEALGYALMMSVWNLTNALSDVTGSWLFQHFRLTFMHLVGLNAGTTLLVLVVVPFLPSVLMDDKDKPEANG